MNYAGSITFDYNEETREGVCIVNHKLNSKNILFQIYETDSGRAVSLIAQIIDENNLEISINGNHGSGFFRIVILNTQKSS